MSRLAAISKPTLHQTLYTHACTSYQIFSWKIIQVSDLEKLLLDARAEHNLAMFLYLSRNGDRAKSQLEGNTLRSAPIAGTSLIL